MANVETARPTLDVPFNRQTRIAAIESEPGVGKTFIPDTHELTNHIGSVHGGALFTVGEAASGRAFFGALHYRLADRALALMPVVKTATIQFVKIAKGEIHATARLATPIDDICASLANEQRAAAVVQVELRDAAGECVATMQVEWYVRTPKR